MGAIYRQQSCNPNRATPAPLSNKEYPVPQYVLYLLPFLPCADRNQNAHFSASDTIFPEDTCTHASVTSSTRHRPGHAGQNKAPISASLTPEQSPYHFLQDASAVPNSQEVLTSSKYPSIHPEQSLTHVSAQPPPCLPTIYGSTHNCPQENKRPQSL